MLSYRCDSGILRGVALEEKFKPASVTAGAPARASGMSAGTRKRAFRRACGRAFRQGSTFYRGQVLTRRFVLSRLSSTNANVLGSQQQALRVSSSHSKVFHPGQRARAPRITVFNWNVGGLAGDTYDNLLVYLFENNVSIALIQETHWSFSSTWSTKHFHCIHSGCGRGVAGCLTLIRQNVCAAAGIKFHEVIPGRILHVQIRLPNTHMDIVNAYQHFCLTGPRGGLDGVVEQRSAFTHRLGQLIHALPLRHIVVLAGDFNAKIAPLGRHIGEATGSHSRREIDEELMSLIRSNQLVCLNTWGPKSSYTCIGPTGATSVIDLVMVRLGHADSMAKRVQHLWNNPLQLSKFGVHVPLLTSISSFWQSWHRSGEKSLGFGKVDVDKFLDAVDQNSEKFSVYLRRIQAGIEALPPHILDVDPVLKQISQDMFGLISPAKAYPYEDSITTVVKSGWRVWKTLQSLTRPCVRSVFQAWMLVAHLERHRRWHKKHRRRCRRNQLHAFIAQAASAAARGDQRTLHQIIRKMAPKQKLVTMQLRGSTGFLLDAEAECAAVQQHMQESFVEPKATCLSSRYCSHLPFGESHLRDSIAKLPPRKAAPSSCATSAVVKHSASIVAPELFRRLSDCWTGNTASIPTSWCSSWLTWIPKPFKDHSKMSGWRGISLQNVLGKAVLKCVETTARNSCQNILCKDPQFAYTAGRGTSEAIFRAMAHQSIAINLGRSTKLTHHELKAGLTAKEVGGGLQVCLDIEKAFDHVSRSSLISSLERHGVDAAATSIICNWHVSTPYISGKHPDAQVAGNIGVRQGCVAAPTLWNLFVHDFLVKMHAVFSEEWIRKHVTIFADDFHLFWCFSSEAEIHGMLHDLRIFLDQLQIHGLRVNYEKTAVLLYIQGRKAGKWRSKLIRGNGKNTKIRLEAIDKTGQAILLPLVTSHKYLGIMLSYRNCEASTLALRKKSAVSTFARLRKWWGSSFPLRDRVRLWYQTVWPTLTYGLVEVGLTKRLLAQFGATVYRQLRRIANSPVHKTGETNISLCKRLGISDPSDHLCAMVLTTWNRRLTRIHSIDTAADDILHTLLDQCQIVKDIPHLLSPWWQICSESWSRSSSIRNEDCRAVRKVLGIEAADVAGIPSLTEPLATEAHAEFVCEACGMIFQSQMAMRRHQTAMHEQSPPSTLLFNVALDAKDGLPTCKFCNASFRYWQGLRQHLNKDTCPQRDLRYATHSQARQDPKSTMLTDPDLIKVVLDQGAEPLLNDQEYCLRAKATCVCCSQWFPTTGALASHLSYAHHTLYQQGHDWMRERLQARVYKVQNPCQWCHQPFAPSTIRQKHCCVTGVQAGILARVHLATAEVEQKAATVDTASSPKLVSKALKRPSAAASLLRSESHKSAESSVPKRPSSAASLLRSESHKSVESSVLKRPSSATSLLRSESHKVAESKVLKRPSSAASLLTSESHKSAESRVLKRPSSAASLLKSEPLKSAESSVLKRPSSLTSLLRSGAPQSSSSRRWSSALTTSSSTSTSSRLRNTSSSSSSSTSSSRLRTLHSSSSCWKVTRQPAAGNDAAATAAAPRHSCSTSTRSLSRSIAEHERCQQATSRRRASSAVAASSAAAAAQESEEQQQERRRKRIRIKGPEQLGPALSTDVKNPVASRGRAKSLEARHGLSDSSQHGIQHTASTTANFTKVERRQGAGCHADRDATQNSLSELLLSGAAATNQSPGRESCGSRSEGGDGQESSHNRSAPLSQHSVGQQAEHSRCEGRRPLSHRDCREADSCIAVLPAAKSHSTVPLNEADEWGVSGQIHHIHDRGQLAAQPWQRNLLSSQHDGGHDCPQQHARASASCHTTAGASGQRTSTLSGSHGYISTMNLLRACRHENPLAHASAYRTWLHHGREDVPITKLFNGGNFCYCNAVMATLIVCHHHIHHHHLASEMQWGMVNDVVRAACLDWRGLHMVPSFQCLLENWPEPQRQHDATEFLYHLSSGVPILERPLARSRIDCGEAGIEDTECLLSFSLSGLSCCLRACLQEWHLGTGGIQALVIAPLLLFIPSTGLSMLPGFPTEPMLQLS